MPGYPTSCLSNAYMLLVPMLRRMARLPDHQPRDRARAARRAASSRTTGRHQFYTVRIADGAAVAGVQGVRRHHQHVAADGYIEIPAQIDIVEAGELVDVKLF